MPDDPTPDPTPTPEPTPEPERTFSQAQLDKVVQERLARERQKYEGFDDFKAKAEKFDEHTAAQKSELEKERDARAAAEKTAAEATARAKEIATNAQISAYATKKGFADPADAVALIDRSRLEFGEDGVPKNATELVDSLLEAKPHLAGQTTTGSADQGARDGIKQITRGELQNMTPQQIVEAEDKGLLKNVLGG